MIEKKFLSESQHLFNTWRAAGKLDRSKEILQLEDAAWKLHQEREREQFLGHQAEAMILKNQIDSLLGRRNNLRSETSNAKTVAYESLRRYNLMHQLPLVAQLENLYHRAERAKFHEVLNAGGAIFHSRIFRLKTNIADVMSYQIRIAELFETFGEPAPLGDLVEKVEGLAKNFPESFESVEVVLHEVERSDFIDNLFIDAADLAKPEFKIKILPSKILRARIESVILLTQPREIYAA